MNIGTAGYTINGMYEGYKVAKDISDNQNITDDDNSPIFPVNIQNFDIPNTPVPVQ